MADDAIPDWVDLTPDTPDLRAAFERAYDLGNLGYEPPGSERVARRVELLLRDRYAELRIHVDEGSRWTVSVEPTTP